MSLAFEPAVPLSNLFGSADWNEADAALTRALGRPALAVPSVRTALLWIMESMGLNRHEHEVLVPRFLGRCVLDSLARAARPVHEPGSRTRLAVAVHPFGLAPDWARLKPALDALGLPVIEDASDALAADEGPAPGTLGKLVALSKLLPCLKGGAFLTERPELAEVIRERRRRPSSWRSWWIMAALAANRSGERREGSAWVESAYALYPHSPSDNALLRRGLTAALGRLDEFSTVERRRLDALRAACPDVPLPPSRRLLRAALLPPSPPRARALSDAGFESGEWTVDVAADLLEPRLEKRLLIPLHPDVPEDAFARLIDSLKEASHDQAPVRPGR